MAGRDEETEMIFKIKNWQDFQHYKDRAPPWIKLHNTLLTSEVWVMGNDATRALVVASMLLASRNNANDGTFNGDPEYVKRFAYLNSTPDFKPLIQYGFIEAVQDASNVLATCNTEERRGEIERDAPKASTNKRASQLPSDFTLTDASVAYANERGVDIHDEMDGFVNYHQAKGSTFKDWQAAWRTWCNNAVKFGRAGKQSAPVLDLIPKIDTSLEARRAGLQSQADESYRTRQWLEGERRWRAVITIEDGKLVRTKHYDDEAAA